MDKYYTRTDVVRAFQFGVEEEPQWFLDAKENNSDVRTFKGYNDDIITELRIDGKYVVVGKYDYVVINKDDTFDIYGSFAFRELFKFRQEYLIMDNIKKILPMLNFNTNDYFYEVQILDRAKDRVDSKNCKTRLIRKYFISSEDNLKSVYGEIKSICDALNCRAYINLDTRSYRATAFQQIEEAFNYIKESDFKSVKKSFNIAKSTSRSRKVFVLDYDNGVNSLDIKYIVKKLSLYTEVLGVIDTPNGKHIILKPFNLKLINIKKLKEYEIKRDAPTLLYCSIKASN